MMESTPEDVNLVQFSTKEESKKAWQQLVI